MKAANLMGGSEAREALVKLEGLVLASRGEDAMLNQAILDSTDEENIVDILIKLKSGAETQALEKTEPAPSPVETPAEGTDAAVAADAGDPRLDPTEAPAT